jgi:hypothetical protein
MTKTYDHYAAGHELASSLLREGHSTWHEKIENAISDGTTATEILMALQFVLTQLKTQSLELSQETRTLLNQLFGEIEASLR